MELKPFTEVRYTDAKGIKSKATKNTLPDGTQIVFVQKENLPKNKAIAMSMDTFLKTELPLVDTSTPHKGDIFTKSK